MKTLEITNKTQITESELSVKGLDFGDVVIYNEMADQTSIKLNLIEQIHAQINQLEELTYKRQFLMREVIDLINI